MRAYQEARKKYDTIFKYLSKGDVDEAKNIGPRKNKKKDWGVEHSNSVLPEESSALEIWEISSTETKSTTQSN